MLRKLGFGKEATRAEQGLCPFCALPADEMTFIDDLSRKEFAISGLCQHCQDKTFGKCPKNCKDHVKQ